VREKNQAQRAGLRVVYSTL